MYSFKQIHFQRADQDAGRHSFVICVQSCDVQECQVCRLTLDVCAVIQQGVLHQWIILSW